LPSPAGCDPEAVFDALCHLRTVRGRMQLVAARAPMARRSFVDYSHTPDALATALRRCARM
jgi:UDP-N-acetylmuramoyl-L-alanyl-D-glutamate--2,6-diaminopimelate ligase